MTENQIIVEPTRQFEPGEVELYQLISTVQSIKLLRSKLKRAIAKRDALVLAALDAGQPQSKVASAAKTSQARVAQIAAKASAS